MDQKLIFKTLILILTILPIKSFSQNGNIKGIIVDSITNQKLPFVNIVYNKSNQGLSSDIDGSFEISNANNIEFLQFSYVGYNPKHLNISKINKDKQLIIKLKLKTFDINEVTVFPGKNPAHRIINKVIENSKINNPESLKSFSCKTYNKMVLTFDIDNSLKDAQNKKLDIDSIMSDSSYIKAKELIDKMYFFMIETLSERKYKNPGKISEKVIATKVSGLKQASFFVLATQLQSLWFYDEMINIAESRYINPISKGSTKRYFFNIEDTTYNQRGDTIFVISFKPKKNKNFEALEGVLNINTHKYAIQNVIAKPVDADGLFNIEIQQNYNLIDDEYWFPAELNTSMVINNVVGQTGALRMRTIGVSKSYVSDIQLNKEISDKEFKIASLEIAEDAHNKDSLFWLNNRRDSLTEKEINTYHVIDSVGEKHNLDLKVKIAQTVSKGYIPLGFLDIAINSIIDYNVFEGFRTGLGLKTNNKISSAFSLGGYFAYGFNDEEFKYGGNLVFNIYKKRDLKLEFGYKNDVVESSGYKFLEKLSLNSSEMYRKYFIRDMTYIEEYSSNIQFISFKHLNLKLNAASQTMHNIKGYYFDNQSNTFVGDIYNFFETALQFRYAPNEKLAYIDNEFFSTTNISSPIFTGNIIKGLKTFDGNYDYLKIEAKFQISYLTKAFGKTFLQLVGAKVWGDVPYFKLYNGHGSYYDFNVESANSFATMRMNEFLSDGFFAVYFRQDFGSLLFKTKKFKPEVLLISSLAYGSLNNLNYHYNIPIKTMENGYFESGILINSIFRQAKFVGYGFGVFYRYGAYAFENIKDNFAYRLSLTFDF
ncbi:MAG: carboxypeptidase-like regulatory domain-containing protein [Bacteroidales bacterium]|nr:carboxypeptidase-like regulatory domain-containing protein [Bacteroidales bacterium]MBN2758678.1 carboxypeptidase-like regulatory domain-containing protein [Bacteroidales bacterium]